QRRAGAAAAPARDARLQTCGARQGLRAARQGGGRARAPGRRDRRARGAQARADARMGSLHREVGGRAAQIDRRSEEAARPLARRGLTGGVMPYPQAAARGSADSPYDTLESREPAQRERDMLAALPALVRRAQGTAAGAERLGRVDAEAITSRQAFARLPVLRKSELHERQKA